MKKLLFIFFFLAPSLLKVLPEFILSGVEGAKDLGWSSVHAQVITIPTVFHVLHIGTGSPEDIPDSAIIAQLRVLNEDFRRTNVDSCSAAPWGAVAADCEIEFCLAQQDPQGNPTNGITRRLSLQQFNAWDNKIKFTVMGGEDIWDRDRYLNIWIGNTNLENGATFPGEPAATDGVVLFYAPFGPPAAPFKSRLGTFYVGQWLNLWMVDGWYNDTCGLDNDSVPDTPNTTSNCFGTTAPCNIFDSCNTSVPAMCCNFMSNASDDNCKCLFTMGQKARMQATLAGPRVSLQSSNGCGTVGVQEINNNNAISIYPNPTSGVFQIQVGNGQLVRKDSFGAAGKIEIYNVLGEMVLQKTINSKQETINLSGARGIYFLHIKTPDGVAVKKIIKE